MTMKGQVFTFSKHSFSWVLETKNEQGKIAGMIACHQKNCTVVELIVKAGADIQAVDANGNTTFIMAVTDAYMRKLLNLLLNKSCSRLFSTYLLHLILFKKLLINGFLALHQICQNAEDEALIYAMRKGAAVSLFCYLSQRGCSWDTANYFDDGD